MANIKNLLDELNTFESTRGLVDKIAAYKDKLAKMPSDKLSDDQKIWLLACQAAESRISKSSKDQMVEDMFLLLKFIPEKE